MKWSKFEPLLGGVNKYSSGFGRVCFSVVFVFRILVFLVAVQQVWGDESKDFSCNTLQPDCTTACYDQYFPISHISLWALQLICIFCLSLMVVSHVNYNEMKDKRFRASNQGSQHINPRKNLSGLCWTYLLSLMFKAGIDVAFLCILYFFYEGYTLPTLIKCNVHSCPNIVNCRISRSTEKTIFTFIMVISSAVYIFMCICEVLHLICKSSKGCNSAHHQMGKRQRT